MRNDCRCEVCIIGLGPAGIGAALTLSNSTLASQVLCLDIGASVDTKSCSILRNGACMKEKPCQMISGFGGCSLLSGGKMSDYPAGSNLATILNSRDLAEEKLSEAIKLLNSYLPLHKQKMGTNKINDGKELFKKLGFEYKYYDVYLYNQKDLMEAYNKIFLQLKSSGMSLLLNTELIQIDSVENGFKLIAKKNEHKVLIYTKYLALGVGRLGRRMLKSLNTKFNLNGKENYLDVGVRLEFPTYLFPEIDKYHSDLKLLFDNARTFCVCKDGKIAPYFLDDVFFTDGYFDPDYRSGFTNLGIMIRLQPSKQNERIYNEIKKRILNVNNGKLLRQSLPNYLNYDSKNYDDAASYKNSLDFYVENEINRCFPRQISKKIKEAVLYFTSRLLPKDGWEEVNVFAPEIVYSGISFPVKSDFSISPSMYLIGDCTGRFRGLLQGFCSGIICAEDIIGNAYGKNV